MSSHENIFHQLPTPSTTYRPTAAATGHSAAHALVSTRHGQLGRVRRAVVRVTRIHTHTHTHNCLTAGTTRVGRYQKKHSPTHTHRDHWTSFISFLHLLRSIASSLFSLRDRLSSLTTSLQVLFGLPLGLGPSISYSMHLSAGSVSGQLHSN